MMKRIAGIKRIILAIVLVTMIIQENYSQQPLKSFPLSAVRLSGGPFYEAQQVDLQYILSMDVDRLLVPFLRDATIPTKAESYGNWENTGLDGHIGGHYLSALSLMYASTGNAEVKRRLYWLDLQVQYYSNLAHSKRIESTSKVYRQPPSAKFCPGEILYKNYIVAMNWTLTDFAKHIGVKKNRLDHLRQGNVIIDFDLACRLGEALDMDPMHWIQLQLEDSLKNSKLLPVR